MDSIFLRERPLTAPHGSPVAPSSLRSRRSRLLERISALETFFTGGLDFDDRLDGPTIWRFAEEIRALLRLLGVPSTWGEGVILKLRRLGQHRADGLYYPDLGVLAVDSRALHSFAHELGHLIDYRARWRPGARSPGPVLSAEASFLGIYLDLKRRMTAAPRLLARLRGARGRVSWRYYSSPSECFARAFEQLAAECLVAPTSAVKRPEALRADELYFPQLPEGIEAYFREVVRSACPDNEREIEIRAQQLELATPGPPPARSPASRRPRAMH